jgi:putative nucleotidyltransferase with HDIG domain
MSPQINFAENLIPISKTEAERFSPLPADFYIKLSENNFVLAGRRGDKKLQDLHVLKNAQSVFELFVHREEYKNCVGAGLQIAEIVVTRDEITDIKKVSFLFQCSESVMKEITELGFNHESLAHAKLASQSLLILIAAKDDLNSLLALLSEQDDQVVRHSMAVSAVSVAIAWQMGWTIDANIQKLALAALLHDVGLKELPKELSEKPRHLMTAQEIKDYENHVMRGVEILSSMPSVPTEVIRVAMEHHENAIGQGYPRHLRDLKMNIFSRIVALADCYCDITIKSNMNPNPRSSVEAVKFIELAMGQPFSKPAFQALKQALNMQPAKKIRRPA